MGLQIRFVTAAALALGMAGSTSAGDGKIYWAQLSGGRIMRASLNGADSEPVAEDLLLVEPVGVAIDPAGGKVYWTQLLTDQILRADPNGANVEPLIEWPLVDDPVAVAVDSVEGRLYWSQRFDDRIIRADLDGNNVEVLFAWPAVDGPEAIAFDPLNRKLYWAETGTGVIRRSDPDGSGVETVISFVLDAVAVAVDPNGGTLYWAQSFSDRIVRSALDGSKPVAILEFPDVDDPVALTVDPDGGKLYWSQRFEDRIRRADLDGTDVETLLEWPQLAEPMGVAVLPDAPGCFNAGTPRAERMPADDAGTLVASTKNRYLSISTDDLGGINRGRIHAIRVTALALPPRFSDLVGARLWADARGGNGPVFVSSAPNRGWTDSISSDDLDFLRAASLRCGPPAFAGDPDYFFAWADLKSCRGGMNNAVSCEVDADCSGGACGRDPFVHLHHEWIVPGASYHIEVLDASCDPSAGTSYSQPLELPTGRFGDVAGPFLKAADLWSAPDGNAQVSIDVLSLIDAVLGRSVAPAKPRADMTGFGTPDVDGAIRIADVLLGIDAALGRSYPFGPEPGACP